MKDGTEVRGEETQSGSKKDNERMTGRLGGRGEREGGGVKMRWELCFSPSFVFLQCIQSNSTQESSVISSVKYVVLMFILQHETHSQHTQTVSDYLYTLCLGTVISGHQVCTLRFSII